MGESYYRNRSDVQAKKTTVAQRSNTKIEHPIVRRLVDQKADYLLSRPFSISADNSSYSDALEGFFDNSFRRKAHSFCKNAVKRGIAYMIPFFRDGRLRFMSVPAWELIPLWLDCERTELDGFIRFYDRTEYQGRDKIIVNYAEYWSREGVQYFKGRDGVYHYDGSMEPVPHFTVDGRPYRWKEVPLIWLRYNDEELPLAYFVKELVDSYNWQTSVTDDVQRDIAKFVYIIRNYGGTDLAEFVKELQECLAIEVDSDGGVEKLQPEVDVTGVLAYLDKQRRDIYDLGAGVDTKDPDLGNASGTALMFRYMGLDNDCGALASGLQAAFERIKLFVDTYFQIIGEGDFSKLRFSVVFNTDMPVNEGEVINNCKSSMGIISKRTIMENHPWVKDADAEQKRLDEEKQDMSDSMGSIFGVMGSDEP